MALYYQSLTGLHGSNRPKSWFLYEDLSVPIKEGILILARSLQRTFGDISDPIKYKYSESTSSEKSI